MGATPLQAIGWHWVNINPFDLPLVFSLSTQLNTFDSAVDL